MAFTAIGKDVDLELGMAKDVIVTRDDRQLKNEEHSSPDWPRQILRRSTNEVKLTMDNARDVPIRLEVNLTVNGEIVSAGSATVTKLNQQSDAFNWRKRVSWAVNLQPGERKEVVLTYSTVFSVGNR
jgi:hypothetical protein